MRKNFWKVAVIMLMAAIVSQGALAADDGIYPKAEMRAAWMAALGIDFPLSGHGSDAASAEKQKAEIVRYIEAMRAAGLNCVFVHMRPMADRLYKLNTYGDVTVDEPWSHYITGTRGVEPSYDPLQVWIDEGHARGMEVHAWLNPYRYCNYSNTSIPAEGFNPYSTPEDKSTFDSGIIIRNSYKSGSSYVTNFVFNPALEASVKRVCDVCTVLAGNYDLDGILFDDYFYPDGTPEGSSAPDYAQYKEYRDNGGTMSMGDWRRDVVNRMVAAVYATCKQVKPWIRFGISPAGAAGKGLKPTDELPALSQFCNAGDWQYNGIYSDPMAWMRNQDLDWISPQIYWTTTHSTNPFGPMTKWWSLVAEKFGRHFFVSTYLSNLGSNNNDAYREELCNQVTIQRRYTEDSSLPPGVVFFSAKFVDGYTNYGLERALKATNFSREALMPAMTWHKANNPGLVSDIKRENNTLSWTGYDNMRYSVYAVPASLPEENFDGDPEYLLGFTYTTDYELPEDRSSGYNYAICCYDRFGYEYSARFLGAAEQTLDAPTLTSPEAGVEVEMPLTFKWNAVEGARTYAVEIARNAEMTDFVAMTSTGGTECSSADFKVTLPLECELYWRVRACAPNYNDGLSEARAIKLSEVRLLTPAHEAENVELAPTFTWTIPERELRLEIATSSDFTERSIVYTAEVKGGSHAMPEYSLAGLTQYFVRGHYTYPNGEEGLTSTLAFTTLKAEPTVPVVVYPGDGGVLHADEHVAIAPMHGPRSIRLEISASESFPGRTSYICSSIAPGNWADSNTGDRITISNKGLVDGKTYYVRARANFKVDINSGADTEFSEPYAFTYSSENAGVKAVEVDANDNAVWYNLQGMPVAHPASGGIYIRRTAEKAEKVLVK